MWTQPRAAFRGHSRSKRVFTRKQWSEQAGDVLPLDRGAGGRVLLAFAGAKGRLYAQIRRDGMVTLSDDRVLGLTGISAPVWGPAAELVGALTLTLPGQRMKPAFVQLMLPSQS